MNADEQILTKVLNCQRSDLYVKKEEIQAADRVLIETMQKRLENGEPLQYILGDVEFCQTHLKVNEHVLIPRYETELLVARMIDILKDTPSVQILDLGTGSGAIAIALAKALPQSRIFAVDISHKAVSLAMDNAQRNRVSDQINFVTDDMQNFLVKLAGKLPRFDVIVSNPPYIARGELAHLPANVQREPRLALDGGEDGLDFYRTIIAHLDSWMTRRGKVFFEIGQTQGKALEGLFQKHPFHWQTHIIKDDAQQDRIFEARRSSVRWINL